MTNKKLAAISLSITIIALAISLSTLFVDTWVSWESESGDVKASLFYWTESESSTEGMSWDCFNKLYCTVADSWDGSGSYERGLCE